MFNAALFFIAIAFLVLTLAVRELAAWTRHVVRDRHRLRGQVEALRRRSR